MTIFDSKSEFYRANNIDPDKLSWLGKGDFGDAYSIGDGRVLKKTTSKKEFSIAEEIVGRDIPHLVKIYAVGEIKLYNYPSQYYIIMEELEEDSSIEDMFYDLMNIVEEQGGSFEYLGDIDYSEYNLSSEMIDFIDTIETIYRVCYNNGIYRPDVRPENLGRDKSGVIKMFDIDSHDRRMEESVRKIIREEFKKVFKIDYPYYKIEKLVNYYEEEFQDYMNKQGWAIFQSDSPSLNDKYNSDYNGYFWQVQVVDEPYGESGFYDQEGNALIGITSDKEAIELVRRTGLMVDDNGAVIGFQGNSLLSEDINIPVNVGDEILTGKFKIKKTKIKSIDKNEKGDVTINDKPALKFRIPDKIKEGTSNEITCKSCGWKWKIESNDKNPHLCHKCGYDNEKNEFDDVTFNTWKNDSKLKNTDEEFEKIKNSKFNSLRSFTLNDIVEDWGNIKSIKNDNIDTIKFFIDKINNQDTFDCLIYDKKGLADGYHRLIAMKIIGVKQFCFVYDENFLD